MTRSEIRLEKWYDRKRAAIFDDLPENPSIAEHEVIVRRLTDHRRNYLIKVREKGTWRRRIMH